MFNKKIIFGNKVKNRILEVECTNCSFVRTIKEQSFNKGIKCGCNYIGTKINNFDIIGYDGKFICKCICGKIIKSKNILLGKQKSCGCLDYGKYGRLTYNESGLICECGKTVPLNRRNLLSGGLQSCGCAREEKSWIGLNKALLKNKIYSDVESEQRIRWRGNYSDMDFDLYKKLSQMNCFYCGEKPNQKFSVNEIVYYRNGIDRVNNNYGHLKFNCVPCCEICNKIKRNKSLLEFYSWIFKFGEYIDNSINIENHKIIKTIYSHYNDGDIDYDYFVKIIKRKCYYCGEIGNCWDGFKYNGLDRLDNNISHYKNNVVSCCGNCNYAKRNMNVQDFKNHICKIKNFTLYKYV